MGALGGPAESPKPAKVSTTSTVEHGDRVWHLRSRDRELFVSRGTVADDREDWWLTVVRDGERVVDDHRVRVVADSDLGEVLAAVLTALKQEKPLRD